MKIVTQTQKTFSDLTGTPTSAPVSVVIPYLSREAHLMKALESWYAQRYAGHLGLVVVDFSDLPSPVDLHRVRLIRSQDVRWNPCRARNLGARNAYGRLLVFAQADMIVEPNFITQVTRGWDKYEMWVTEGMLRDVPYDPSLNGLIVVKRWINTRLRGFHEPLMENPHGWGYDAVDYRLRAQMLLRKSGCSIGDFKTEAVTVLSHSDHDRVEPYDNKDLEETYRAHEAYSRWYREVHGFVANKGQDWGQPW